MTFPQNHGLNFAFSTDLGETWQNTWDQTIGNMTAEKPILPVSAGIVIFGIPKYGLVILGLKLLCIVLTYGQRYSQPRSANS